MTVFLVLCLAMMFVCSCQNGDSAADVAGGALYKVNLSVELPADGPQRTISVSGGSVSGELTYWYKATPNWTNDAVVGKVAEFTQITSYTEGKDLGYFQQGQWTFDIQVRSAKGAVLYTGTETAYVNASGTPVVFDVAPAFDDTMPGTITVDVDATRVVASGDKLVISYGSVANRATATETITVAPNGSSTETKADFDKETIDGLAAGMYWVKLEYKNGDNTVGAATLDVTVDGGETAAITGTLDYGHFQNASLSVNGLAVLELTLAAKNNSDEAVTEIVENQTVKFTCTATPSDGAAYQWYINGALMPGNEATYSWTPSEAQFANIACAVTRGNIAMSINMDFTVTE